MSIKWDSSDNFLMIRQVVVLGEGFPGDSAVKNLPAMQETQEMWV